MLYSLIARLLARIPTWPQEARDFVVGVVTAGGRVTRTRSEELAGTILVEQPLDDIRTPFEAFVRPGTSDLAVWNQVVGDRQYAPVVRILNEVVGVEVETILDLGANIGLATAYFGAVYPKARILAVEPDPGTFQLLKRNTEKFGDRVCTRQAAFWIHDMPLKWTSERFRDGREWARAVEPARDRGASIDVTTPAKALAYVGVKRADLAKIDIEGAEAAFFATDEGTEALLNLADVFAIELHAESVDAVDAAISFERNGFLTVPVGDYVIAIRRERAGRLEPS